MVTRKNIRWYWAKTRTHRPPPPTTTTTTTIILTTNSYTEQLPSDWGAGFPIQGLKFQNHWVASALLPSGLEIG